MKISTVQPRGFVLYMSRSPTKPMMPSKWMLTSKSRWTMVTTSPSTLMSPGRSSNSILLVTILLFQPPVPLQKSGWLQTVPCNPNLASASTTLLSLPAEMFPASVVFSCVPDVCLWHQDVLPFCIDLRQRFISPNCVCPIYLLLFSFSKPFLDILQR